MRKLLFKYRYCTKYFLKKKYNSLKRKNFVIRLLQILTNNFAILLTVQCQQSLAKL